MKTKVMVEILPTSEKKISTVVVLEKANYDDASGSLRTTILELDFKDRITIDELDSVANERNDYKIVFNKTAKLVCPAEAITGISPKGKRYYFLKVQLSETVSRNFFFNPRQKANMEKYNIKYHFNFTEKVNDEVISMLDLMDKADLEDDSNKSE